MTESRSLPHASERPTRLRVLIGAYRPDMEDDPSRVRPMIGGAMDEGTWEVLPPEESDAIFARMKREAAGGDEGDYDWREIVVELDTAYLRFLLAPATVKGIVKGSET